MDELICIPHPQHGFTIYVPYERQKPLHELRESAVVMAGRQAGTTTALLVNAYLEARMGKRISILHHQHAVMTNTLYAISGCIAQMIDGYFRADIHDGSICLSDNIHSLPDGDVLWADDFAFHPQPVIDEFLKRKADMEERGGVVIVSSCLNKRGDVFDQMVSDPQNRVIRVINPTPVVSLEWRSKEDHYREIFGEWI